MVAAKPTFDLVAKNEFGRGAGVFNASPAIADGALFLRSDNFLYCIKGSPRGRQ